MLLKRQTVWLLTMLSLVVVLSVYYIVSPDQQPLVADENENEVTETEELSSLETDIDEQEVASLEDTDSEIITSLADDEMFTTLRLQALDERSRKNEELSKLVGATDISAEERNKALDEINEIKRLAEKEYLLETLIKTLDYEDVLVRANEDEVKVTVKANELSRSEANEILQLAMKELGNDQMYTVEFQPEK